MPPILVSMARIAWVLALAAAAYGCGDDMTVDDASADASPDAMMPDGGIDASADTGLELPFDLAPPDVPWLEDGQPPVDPPTFGTCPDGWSEATIAGELVCEPWVRGGAEECPATEIQLGGGGCAPVGTACPSGDFAADLPSGAPTVFVREGAMGMADGSMGAPYGSIRDATRAGLASGTVVALSLGMHEVEGALPDGLRLIGACASGTVLTRGRRAAGAVVAVDGTELQLENLSVDADADVGVEVLGDMGMLTMDGVEVSGAECAAVHVHDGGVLTATRLSVRGTTACAPPSSGTPGGLVIEDGGAADIRESSFVDNAAFSIRVLGSVPMVETRLLLEDSVVRQTSDDPAETVAAWLDGEIVGVGLFVDQEAVDPAGTATITVARTLFEQHPGGHVVLRGVGASGDFDQLVLREAGSLDATLLFTWISGVSVLEGASLDFRRSTITATLVEATAAAITVRDGAVLSLTDLVVAENKSNGLLTEGFGTTIDAERVVFAGNRSGAVGVIFGPVVRLSDVRMTDPASIGLLEIENPAVSGTAVLAILGEVELRDCIIEGHIEAVTALFESVVTVEDVLASNISVLGGGALVADDASQITARRFVADHASNRAMSIFRDSSLVLEDAIIRDTRADVDAALGRALDVENGSRAELRRVEIVRSRDVGIFTFGDCELSLEDVRVIDTRLQDCVETIGCSGHGHALGVYDSSRLTADRFTIEGAATCGVHLAIEAEVDLTNGVITGAEIGACVQVDDYDLDRLSGDVAYSDNATNLDSTSLPLPEPSAAL